MRADIGALSVKKSDLLTTTPLGLYVIQSNTESA